MNKFLNIIFFILVATVFSCNEKNSATIYDTSANNLLAGNRIESKVTSEILPDTFTEVSFIDENNGWAISSNLLWRTYNGGTSWAKVLTLQDTKVGSINLEANITQIQAISKSKILILDFTNGLMETTETTGKIKVLFPSEKGIIRSFHFLDENNGWVVGQSNTKNEGNWDAIAYKTQDGGKSWRPIQSNLLVNCSCSFYDVLLINKENVFLVGDIFMETRDGGKTLKTFERRNSLEGKIFGTAVSIESLNRDLLWITSNQGNKFIVSYNGGKTWKTKHLPSEQLINSLKFLNNQKVLALSDNKVWESFDSGFSWEIKQEIDNDVYYLYQIPNTKMYYVVGKIFIPIIN